MTALYPKLIPNNEGWLDVDPDHGHRMYWCTSGNPKGKPVLMIHGGPGSGHSSMATILAATERFK